MSSPGASVPSIAGVVRHGPGCRCKRSARLGRTARVSTEPAPGDDEADERPNGERPGICPAATGTTSTAEVDKTAPDDGAGDRHRRGRGVGPHDPAQPGDDDGVRGRRSRLRDRKSRWRTTAASPSLTDSQGEPRSPRERPGLGDQLQAKGGTSTVMRRTSATSAARQLQRAARSTRTAPTRRSRPCVS
jgi:hypothetical protein